MPQPALSYLQKPRTDFADLERVLLAAEAPSDNADEAAEDRIAHERQLDEMATRRGAFKFLLIDCERELLDGAAPTIEQQSAVASDPAGLEAKNLTGGMIIARYESIHPKMWSGGWESIGCGRRKSWSKKAHTRQR